MFVRPWISDWNFLKPYKKKKKKGGSPTQAPIQDGSEEKLRVIRGGRANLANIRRICLDSFDRFFDLDTVFRQTDLKVCTRWRCIHL